jgi:hypothetical protein
MGNYLTIAAFMIPMAPVLCTLAVGTVAIMIVDKVTK